MPTIQISRFTQLPQLMGNIMATLNNNLVISALNNYNLTTFQTITESGSRTADGATYYLQIGPMGGGRIVRQYNGSETTMFQDQHLEELLAQYNRMTGAKEKPDVFNVMLSTNWLNVYTQWIGSGYIKLWVAFQNDILPLNLGTKRLYKVESTTALGRKWWYMVDNSSFANILNVMTQALNDLEATVEVIQ